jgi:hypothetical protein
MFDYQSPYLPTDAQELLFKYIKIYTKTAPTCFGLITVIRERMHMQPHHRTNHNDVF